MTLNRRRRAREAAVPTAEIIRRALVEGMAYRLDEAGRSLPIPSDDQLRDAWAVMGRELTAEFVEANPGRRPWGWWRFTPGAIPLGREWPLHVQQRQGGVPVRDRCRLPDLVQRLRLQILGELTEDELARLEPIDDPQAAWDRLHSAMEGEP